jgi:hypothetical protein
MHCRLHDHPTQIPECFQFLKQSEPVKINGEQHSLVLAIQDLLFISPLQPPQKLFSLPIDMHRGANRIHLHLKHKKV